LGPKGTIRERWFFTVTLCVKEKFGNSYKDIPDEKFQEVVDYISFLKEQPKLSKRTFKYHLEKCLVCA